MVSNDIRNSSLQLTLSLTHAVDCGVPEPPMNGSVVYTRTTEGANLTFDCDIFFFPVDTPTAVCTREGVWVPLPAEYNCTLDGKSFIPMHHALQ